MERSTATHEVSLLRAESRGLVLLVVLFSIFANLLMLTGPLFMLQVYDRVLASRSEETLVALFLLVTLLYLFYGLLEYARGRVMARVGARLQSGLDERVFSACLEYAALRKTDQPRSSAIQHLKAIRAFYSAPVVLALLDLPWTPIFLAAMFVFHPMMGSLAVAGGAVLIGVTFLNQLVTCRKQAGAAAYTSSAEGLVNQVEDRADYLRAQGMGGAMRARWKKLQDAAMERALSTSDWSGSFASFIKAFRLFLQSAILALGAWLVLQNALTGGAMIAASILLGRALAPVEQTLSQWSIVQRARDGEAALRAFLIDNPDVSPPTELSRPKAQLSVKDVSVIVRPGDGPVLRNVGFEINPGEAIGVIGKSGSGKSTLARVILGLVRPVAGEVRLAGAALDQYGPDRLGRFIGYLPQDICLFDGTVAENIAHMETDADAARVEAAARKAGMHEIILRLPEGYDTQVGQAGVQLSGGQKQRLAFTRALYNDPVLLVLDEPNSALDADGSAAFNAGILQMKQDGCAVLIMTHRPAAISACDKLLVLDGGKVAAWGPRVEVIKSIITNATSVERLVAQSAGS